MLSDVQDKGEAAQCWTSSQFVVAGQFHRHLLLHMEVGRIDSLTRWPARLTFKRQETMTAIAIVLHARVYLTEPFLPLIQYKRKTQSMLRIYCN